MEFYSGDIASAITLAKNRGAVFVVFVLGKQTCMNETDYTEN